MKSKSKFYLFYASVKKRKKGIFLKIATEKPEKITSADIMSDGSNPPLPKHFSHPVPLFMTISREREADGNIVITAVLVANVSCLQSIRNL